MSDFATRTWRAGGLATVLLVLAACAGSPPPTSAERYPRQVHKPSTAPVAATRPRQASAVRSLHERAATIALRQLGVPYRFGGADPSGFDCSGLVQFAYRHAGLRVPRTTRTQWQAFHPVSRENMRIGDVLFFRIDGKMSHVGLYVGNNRFVHAPSSGKQVTVQSLDAPFYRQAFLRGGRP